MIYTGSKPQVLVELALSDEVKNWFAKSWEGTPILAILAVIASIAWMLAEMKSDIKAIKQAQEETSRINIGARITALEFKIQAIPKDIERLEESIEEDLSRLGRRVDKMDTTK